MVTNGRASEKEPTIWPIERSKTIEMLPALVGKMQKHGHVLEFATYGISAAIEVIIS